MALPSRFSLLNANLDAFLFASIGKEESGMSLSVASALARLGSDPWIEAERFAGMPQAMATDALAAMLARIPKAGWKPSESRAIADRLVVTEGAVEKHISSIFAKLGLATSDTEHRRVLAVLRYLQHG